MLGGFALVAYPAQSGVSGIMTFIVNHDGVVYEKDLGPNTATMAQSMTKFNPDKTWKKLSPSDQGSCSTSGKDCFSLDIVLGENMGL